MTFEDKVLTCKECGAEFTFSASEQEFYAEKASRTNPLVARSAVLPASASATTTVPKEKCSA